MLTYTEISKNKVKTDVLIGLFIAVIIVIGYVFSVIYGSYAIMVIAILFSTITALFSYYNSDKIALSASKAVKVDRATNQELYRVVENLAIAGGLPTPEIYVINDPAMNAFATGRDPKHAVVCVTSGLLANMNREELEGVIAHELSHVGNYDIRLSTIVVVLAGSLALISNFFLRSSLFGFGQRRSNNNNGNNGLFLIIGLLLAILAPISATLIQLAISRKREFLADASGALLSRYPEGLASALEKIRDADMPVSEANPATAHLYFTNPLKGNNVRNGQKRQSVFAGLFDTHPDINERIRRLRGMDKPGNL